LIVVGLRLCGHRHFRLENVLLPPVSLAAEICSVLRFAYPAGKASEAIRRIWNEKRPSLIVERFKIVLVTWLCRGLSGVAG
jgi:hypothetical protein